MDRHYLFNLIAPFPIPEWDRPAGEVERFRKLMAHFDSCVLFHEPPPELTFTELSEFAAKFESAVMGALAEVDTDSLGKSALYELARCCSELKRRLRRADTITNQLRVFFGEYRGLVYKNMDELQGVYLRQHQR